ncbi:CGNR zinc finger domain-containing protein [Microbacterium wangchenii]|uniref:CGNR zinc finger domain-containing protein n=2 Tax=Microbacteriaceae TaxID=85023 RepID=A0ABX5SXE2_9MICO|nr:CGNR zinc finger domain-containing protein [Microbacterium wangchenii]TXK16908.1 CGNR zinc finger domain-containing protein [Microbacterium wangchenii]
MSYPERSEGDTPSTAPSSRVSLRSAVTEGEPMTDQTSAVVEALPLPLLIRIVNEYGDAPRSAAGESASPYPPADALGQEDTAFWAHRAAPQEKVLVETANLLHPVFAAASGGECADRLNTVIAEAGLTPAMTAREWDVREQWRTCRPGRTLLAAATLALLHHLRSDPDVSRLGTCLGDACVDVFVDSSPGRRRQYCSLTCQNRARTRAYRARRAAASRSAQ